MRKRLLVFLLTCLIAVSVSAQDATTPDYAIRNIRSHFTEANQQTVVEFEIWNIGAAATKQSTASLKVISTGQEIATDIIPALKSQEDQRLERGGSRPYVGKQNALAVEKVNRYFSTELRK